MSFDDVVNVLKGTEVVAIITTKANGQPRATPIWSLVVDGVPYVRSVFGADARWYQEARTGRPVSFAIADGALAESDPVAALDLPREQVEVTQVPADDPVQSAIDAEVYRKYLGGPNPIDTMLTDVAWACTLRVERC